MQNKLFQITKKEPELEETGSSPSLHRFYQGTPPTVLSVHFSQLITLNTYDMALTLCS